MCTFPGKVIGDIVASALLSLGSPGLGEASCRAVRTHENSVEMPTWRGTEASRQYPEPTCLSCECTILEIGLSAPVKPSLDPNPGQQFVCNFTQLSHSWIHRRPTTFLKEMYWHKQAALDWNEQRQYKRKRGLWTLRLLQAGSRLQNYSGANRICISCEKKNDSENRSLSPQGRTKTCNHCLQVTELITVEPDFKLKQSGCQVHASRLCIIPCL